jgi:hypothetical protein
MSALAMKHRPAPDVSEAGRQVGKTQFVVQ